MPETTSFTVCQLHFGHSPDGRYGRLIDPNGHSWKICSGCINSLWEAKQPFYQQEDTDAANRLAYKALAIARRIDCECMLCLSIRLAGDIFSAGEGPDNAA